MKSTLLLALFLPLQVHAQSGADLLLEQSGNGNTATQISFKSHKQLELDDPFLVQLYGSWKSAGKLNFEVNSWMNLIVNKKYEKAAHLISVIKKKAPSNYLSVVEAASLYLYWKLNLNQTFFNAWLRHSAESNFLKSQLGVALDQTISKNASLWFINNGIHIGPDQKLQLKSLRTNDNRFNILAQSWSALRTGEEALYWLPKLAQDDPLRFRLAQTIVVDLARQRKLGAAAKLLKQVYEPKLHNSDDLEKISSYYMLLARLLYQAGAMDASEHYYRLIPEKSQQFLQARVEALWISLRKGDMPHLKGELASLDLKLFDDKFLPEVYLVSSIAHLKLCQFQNVKKAFDSYIRVNKNWAAQIRKNRLQESPALINEYDYYLNIVLRGMKSQKIEKEQLDRLAQASVEATVPAIGVQEHWLTSRQDLNTMMSMTAKRKQFELRKRWENRQKILDSSIRKMRFVKIEFISLMRRYAQKLEEKSGVDKVTTFAAASAKKNQLEFPFDGMAWGDEPFHLTAEVKSLCLAGKE